jgi:hypothetical protein
LKRCTDACAADDRLVQALRSGVPPRAETKGLEEPTLPAVSR